MAIHNELGKKGEDFAVEYLERNGYKILARNWRQGQYEIDIIAQTEDELVIVEVKTRTNSFYSNPEDAVTNKKINHIVSATDLFIKSHNVDLPARFDIISILGSGPNFDIDHIEDAFYPPIMTYRR